MNFIYQLVDFFTSSVEVYTMISCLGLGFSPLVSSKTNSPID